MAKGLNWAQRLALKAFFGITPGRGDISNIWSGIVGNINSYNGQTLESTIKDGYSGNGSVYSIIRMIVDKAKVAPWAEYQITDTVAYKEYKAAQSTASSTGVKNLQREVKYMKDAALKPVTITSKIGDLISKPNPEDAWSDIVDLFGVYKLSTGNSFIRAKLLDSGKNIGQPQELYTLPSQWMQLIVDLGMYPHLLPIGYRLMYGEPNVFLREEILHDKYSNPNWSTTGEQLMGLAPLQAAYLELSRDNKGKQRAVSSYEHGGPPGVMSIDGGPGADGAFLQTQVDMLKARMAEYEGSYNANKPAFSGYPAKWTAIGLSPVDLELAEVEGHNLDSLCRPFKVPSLLLSRQGSQSYNNWIEARKALVTDCALPLLCDMRDQLNRKFETDWKAPKGRVCDFSMHVYPELEADRMKQAQWLNTAWWLPPQMKYEQMGLDIPDYISEEDLQQIILPSGLTALDIANAGVLPKGLNPYEL